MPALDRSGMAPLGPNAHTRERRTWPRCKACGERLHPSLAGAGTHALCSQLAPATWDRLAGWAA